MSLLEIENASVFYGDFQALYDINIRSKKARSSPASVPTGRANPPC